MERQIRRLLVTADLHYGLYPRGDMCTGALAEHVCASGADALIIAGDVADAKGNAFRRCLNLFADFDGLKMLVPGNHDVWCEEGGSAERYREWVPTECEAAGFRVLDVGPVRTDGAAFIGNMGWYDYSFRNPDLDKSLEDYAGKTWPGVCTWNDGRFIDWEDTDAEFTQQCVEKLRTDYAAVADDADDVIVTLHHLPFRELLYAPRAGKAHEFCRAYMGAEVLGRTLADLPKVRYVFCGHRHGADHYSNGRLDAFVVGSEYQKKRLLELNLDTGVHDTQVFDPARAASAGSETGPTSPTETWI